jgi:hypothetical protein
MTDDTSQAQASGTKVQQLYRVHLPGFVSDEDIGLGDVVTRATSLFGIKPCEGCKRRSTALNRWMGFSGRLSR